MRHKDVNWSLAAGTKKGDTTEHSWESIHAAILMDIRDELKSLNAVLHCANFVQIPWTLKKIQYNTAKPKRKLKQHAKKQ